MITNVHAEVHCWGGKDVVCLRWEWNGKTRKNVYLGSGKHYSARRTVDKPTMAMLEALEARKVSQAEAKELLAGKYKRLIPQLEAKG